MPEDLFELQEAVDLLKKRGHAVGQSSHNNEGMLYVEIDGKRRMSTSLRHLGSEFKLPLASPQVG